jgi:hypothetical protein
MKKKNPAQKGKMDPRPSHAKGAANGELSEDQLERVAGGRKAGGDPLEYDGTTPDGTTNYLKIG